MSKLNKFCNTYLTTPFFAKRAYSDLEALDGDDYRLRRGEGTKELVEEILPLAAFLKHFERPGRSVSCRFFVGNQNYDAKIKLKGEEVDQGYIEASYFVEITSAVSPTDYLLREALTRYGGIAGYHLRRIGSKKKGNDQIIGEGGHDFDTPLKDAIKWTRSALEKKYAKTEPYPRPCILIVQVHPERPLNLDEWAKLAKEVQIDRDKFRATYIVNWWTNTVFEV